MSLMRLISLMSPINLMKILTVPNPALTQKARPVGKIDAKIRRIIAEMRKALAASKIGVGLAAPQIGIPLQIFIVAHKSHKTHVSHESHKSHKTHESYKPLVFLNPQITYRGPTSVLANYQALKRKSNLRKPPQRPRPAGLHGTATNLEGCLSLPNVWGKVNRAYPLKLKYLNEKGERKQRTFRGFLATIVQHEVDHLNGILFTEHVLSQGKKLYRQVKDKKTGKVVMKEIEI